MHHTQYSFPGILFDNSFQTLPTLFYERVSQEPLTQPRLAAVSEPCLNEMGWELANEQRAPLLQWLNGMTRLPGDQKIATRYAGHQFGVWAGQLGDGRAISLGEWINQSGVRREIQVKGAGLTPFSRMGDGKAVIRSSVREFLASEAMHGLRIPTTRAVALIVGEDPVERETIERSALVARVFETNLRFGHFEYAKHFKHEAELEALLNYTHATFYKNLKSLDEVFFEIVRRTAHLMAKWMTVGFNHGVMNTDNFSITGVTIDYGPFGFLEKTRLDHICNHSDPSGRYSFQNQPSIGLWNLQKLAPCFHPWVSRESLLASLEIYEAEFKSHWLDLMSAKIGLSANVAASESLIESWVQLLDQFQIDFTFGHRQIASGPEGLAMLVTTYPNARGALNSWWEQYLALAGPEAFQPEQIALRLQLNPKYVLKNSIAQEIIEQVEANNFQALTTWLEILARPFDEHPEFHRYSLPSAPEAGEIVVSCSS